MTNTLKIFAAITAATMITACTSSDDAKELGELETEEQAFGKATGNFTAEEWFPGRTAWNNRKGQLFGPHTSCAEHSRYGRRI